MALLALMKIFKYNGVTVKQLAQENVLSRKAFSVWLMTKTYSMEASNIFRAMKKRKCSIAQGIDFINETW